MSSQPNLSPEPQPPAAGIVQPEPPPGGSGAFGEEIKRWATPVSKRALIAMAILLLIAAVAILVLSSPARREIYLAGELDSFQIPQAAELDLPRVTALHLRGMQITISRISSLQLRDPQFLAAKPFSGELFITGATGHTAASAVLRPNGRRGPFTLSIPEGTTVSARLAPDQKSLRLTHKPPAAGAVTAVLEADVVDIAEANRVLIQPTLPWTQKHEPASRSLLVANPDGMVQANSVCREECIVDLPKAEFSWLRDGSPMPLKPSQPVTLRNFRVTSVVLRGVKDADVNNVYPSSLDIVPGKDFTLVAVDAIAQTSGRIGAVVKIAGRGNVESVRQDGREVLPSRAADLTSADPARRGVFGGAALFVLFAWGVLFKRAVDILAKNLLPE